jgi:anaerobic magnesium-protoporphyrin IX monomethyl ester cyclase
MKVLLFNIKGASVRKCINKDLAGGMGTGTWIGDSWRARIFEFVKRKNVVLPEITIAYITAIFKKAGWEVQLVEVGQGLEFDAPKADLVLVPSSIVDCRHELEIIKILKGKGFYIGVFGAFASAVPDFFLADVDFIIKGESEAGVLKIISDGLPKGILSVTPIENLDSLPYPDWSLFPLKEYSYSPALNKKPVTVMLASRGCPYGCCFYCPYPGISGRKVRFRSPEKVVEEMEYLKNNYGIRAIDFRDPIFTLNKERVLKFASELIRKKLGIIWSCETRVDCLDEDLLKVMYQAGLRHINIGVESVSPDVLKKSSRRGADISHQNKIVEFCHKNGISIAAFYIIGMEGDTEESFLHTINYAKELNTLVAQFTISTPYPGTAFFDKLKNEGRIDSFDWEEYDAYTPVLKHEFLSGQELLALKEKAFISYYFRPAYFLKHMPKYFFEKFLCQVVKIRLLPGSK